MADPQDINFDEDPPDIDFGEDPPDIDFGEDPPDIDFDEPTATPAPKPTATPEPTPASVTVSPSLLEQKVRIEGGFATQEEADARDRAQSEIDAYNRLSMKGKGQAGKERAEVIRLEGAEASVAFNKSLLRQVQEKKKAEGLQLDLDQPDLTKTELRRKIEEGIGFTREAIYEADEKALGSLKSAGLTSLVGVLVGVDGILSRPVRATLSAAVEPAKALDELFSMEPGEFKEKIVAQRKREKAVGELREERGISEILPEGMSSEEHAQSEIAAMSQQDIADRASTMEVSEDVTVWDLASEFAGAASLFARKWPAKYLESTGDTASIYRVYSDMTQTALIFDRITQEVQDTPDQAILNKILEEKGIELGEEDATARAVSSIHEEYVKPFEESLVDWGYRNMPGEDIPLVAREYAAAEAIAKGAQGGADALGMIASWPLDIFTFGQPLGYLKSMVKVGPRISDNVNLLNDVGVKMTDEGTAAVDDAMRASIDTAAEVMDAQKLKDGAQKAADDLLDRHDDALAVLHGDTDALKRLVIRNDDSPQLADAVAKVDEAREALRIAGDRARTLEDAPSIEAYNAAKTQMEHAEKVLDQNTKLPEGAGEIRVAAAAEMNDAGRAMAVAEEALTSANQQLAKATAMEQAAAFQDVLRFIDEGFRSGGRVRFGGRTLDAFQEFQRIIGIEGVDAAAAVQALRKGIADEAAKGNGLATARLAEDGKVVFGWEPAEKMLSQFDSVAYRATHWSLEKSGPVLSKALEPMIRNTSALLTRFDAPYGGNVLPETWEIFSREQMAHPAAWRVFRDQIVNVAQGKTLADTRRTNALERFRSLMPDAEERIDSFMAASTLVSPRIASAYHSAREIIDGIKNGKYPAATAELYDAAAHGALLADAPAFWKGFHKVLTEEVGKANPLQPLDRKKVARVLDSWMEEQVDLIAEDAVKRMSTIIDEVFPLEAVSVAIKYATGSAGDIMIRPGSIGDLQTLRPDLLDAVRDATRDLFPLMAAAGQKMKVRPDMLDKLLKLIERTETRLELVDLTTAQRQKTMGGLIRGDRLGVLDDPQLTPSAGVESYINSLDKDVRGLLHHPDSVFRVPTDDGDFILLLGTKASNVVPLRIPGFGPPPVKQPPQRVALGYLKNGTDSGDVLHGPLSEVEQMLPFEFDSMGAEGLARYSYDLKGKSIDAISGALDNALVQNERILTEDFYQLLGQLRRQEVAIKPRRKPKRKRKGLTLKKPERPVPTETQLSRRALDKRYTEKFDSYLEHNNVKAWDDLSSREVQEVERLLLDPHVALRHLRTGEGLDRTSQWIRELLFRHLEDVTDLPKDRFKDVIQHMNLGKAIPDLVDGARKGTGDLLASPIDPAQVPRVTRLLEKFEDQLPHGLSREAYLKQGMEELEFLAVDPIPVLSKLMEDTEEGLKLEAFVKQIERSFIPKEINDALRRIEDPAARSLLAAQHGLARLSQDVRATMIELPKGLEGVVKKEDLAQALKSGMSPHSIYKGLEEAYPANKELLQTHKRSIIKGLDRAVSEPHYAPAQVAEYLEWMYKPSGIARAAGELPQPVRDVYNAFHAHAKLMLTVMRTPFGYLSTNIVGNVLSGVQEAGAAALNPMNHIVAGKAMLTGTDAFAPFRDVPVELPMYGNVKLDTLRKWAIEDSIVDPPDFAAETYGTATGKLFHEPITVAGRGGKRDLLSPEVPPLEVPASRLSTALDELQKTPTTPQKFIEYFKARAEEVGVEEAIRLVLIPNSITDDAIAAFTKHIKKDVVKAFTEAGKKVGTKTLVQEGLTLGSGAAIGAFFGAATPVGGIVGALMGLASTPAWTKAWMKINSSVESKANMTLYVGGLRAGKSRTQAKAMANSALRNYNDQTPFQRSVIGKVFTFSTWEIGNLQFQNKFLFGKGKEQVRELAHIGRLWAMYYDQQFDNKELSSLPDYWKWRLLLKGPKGAITSMPPLPLLDAGGSAVSVTGGSAELYSRITPLAKMGLDYFTGYDIEKERQIDELTYYGGRPGWTPELATRLPEGFQRAIGLEARLRTDSETGLETIKLNVQNPKALRLARSMPLWSSVNAWYRIMLPSDLPGTGLADEKTYTGRGLRTLTGINTWSPQRVEERIEKREARFLWELNDLSKKAGYGYFPSSAFRLSDAPMSPDEIEEIQKEIRDEREAEGE